MAKAEVHTKVDGDWYAPGEELPADDEQELSREEELEEMNLDELKDLAKDLDMTGYSKLNKTPLIKEIIKVESKEK